MQNPSRPAAQSLGGARATPDPRWMDIAGLSQSTYMLKALASREGVRTMLGAF